MTHRRALLLAGIACTGMAALLPAHAASKPPPNLLRLDERWLTAGQPSADWLATLTEQGIAAVLYLAPPTVEDAVATEPEIVRAQGLHFANLPVAFGRPSVADYRAFEAQMRDWRKQRLSVLVHCQVNMRASTFSFLYRVINEAAEPDRAWAAVSQVWTPSGPWKRLVQDLLGLHGIAFDPF
jgi:protein tyrosine phosphatase (PTP) superfamily phosphohydrolase (DUF442 family)